MVISLSNRFSTTVSFYMTLVQAHNLSNAKTAESTYYDSDKLQNTRFQRTITHENSFIRGKQFQVQSYRFTNMMCKPIALIYLLLGELLNPSHANRTPNNKEHVTNQGLNHIECHSWKTEGTARQWHSASLRWKSDLQKAS